MLFKCSFLLLAFALASQACVITKKTECATCVYSNMIVMEVLPKDATNDFTEIIFQTSARVYKLPTKNSSKYLKLLLNSKNKNVPVIIKRETENSEIILDVKEIPQLY